MIQLTLSLERYPYTYQFNGFVVRGVRECCSNCAHRDHPGNYCERSTRKRPEDIVSEPCWGFEPHEDARRLTTSEREASGVVVIS